MLKDREHIANCAMAVKPKYNIFSFCTLQNNFTTGKRKAFYQHSTAEVEQNKLVGEVPSKYSSVTGLCDDTVFQQL